MCNEEKIKFIEKEIIDIQEKKSLLISLGNFQLTEALKSYYDLLNEEIKELKKHYE